MVAGVDYAIFFLKLIDYVVYAVESLGLARKSLILLVEDASAFCGHPYFKGAFSSSRKDLSDELQRRLDGTSQWNLDVMEDHDCDLEGSRLFARKLQGVMCQKPADSLTVDRSTFSDQVFHAFSQEGHCPFPSELPSPIDPVLKRIGAPVILVWAQGKPFGLDARELAIRLATECFPHAVSSHVTLF